MLSSINNAAMVDSSKVLNRTTYQNNNQEIEKSHLSNVQDSTVVNLQGSIKQDGNETRFAVDKDNAATMVADIASLLNGNTMGVQSSINGFDAARLLSD